MSFDGTGISHCWSFYFFACSSEALGALRNKKAHPAFSRTGFQCLSGRQDSNLRPPGPKPGTLPDCATPRTIFSLHYFNFRDPTGARTPNRQLRRLMLYPVELSDHVTTLLSLTRTSFHNHTSPICGEGGIRTPGTE